MLGPHRATPAVLAVLVTCLVPALARAIPPPHTEPQRGALLGLVTADPHGLTLARERFRLRFDGAGRCEVEVRYELQNAGAERVTIVAAYLLADIVGAHIEVEGDADAARQLTDYERGAIESALETRGLAARVAEPGTIWRGLELTVEPGATRTVIVRAQLTTEQTVDPVELFIPAIRERHLMLGPDTVATRAERVHVLTAVTALWGSNRQVEVETRAPEGWTLSTPLRAIRESDEGDEHVLVSRMSGVPPEEIVASGAVPDSFPAFSFGGPFIGLGGTFDDGFRLRLGVEVGLGKYFIAALHLDVNFDGIAVLAPVIEAATPCIVIIPSLAAGVGPAFHFDGTGTRVGVRMQGTIHLIAGIVLSVDVYPAGNSPGFVETTLLGTIGL